MVTLMSSCFLVTPAETAPPPGPFDDRRFQLGLIRISCCICCAIC
jgi:hypothetical protein